MVVFDPGSQRVRLFKNERLEKLSLISPRAFALGWSLMLPLIAWVGWGSASLLASFGLFAGGLLFWSLFEYVMHRYLFHLEPKQPLLKWLVFVIHGNHHDHPNDPLRDLMPFSVSLSVSAVVWGSSVALIGMSGTWLFLGYITGYVIYDTVHYACHQWPMRSTLGSALKRHHMRHHHVDNTANFAISAIFWDRVFGSRVSSLKR